MKQFKKIDLLQLTDLINHVLFHLHQYTALKDDALNMRKQGKVASLNVCATNRGRAIARTHHIYIRDTNIYCNQWEENCDRH